MPPASRKRRMVADEAESDQQGSSEEEVPRSTQRRRRGQPATRDTDEDEDDFIENSGPLTREDMEIDDEGGEGESQDQLVKKLVRYALACEYSRQPIRREGIREKVLGKHKVPFKRIFDGAQTQLRTKFGMEMTELPQKEKVTLKDRRAAQKSQSSSSQTPASSKAYILTSTLPSTYCTSNILAPSIAPTAAEEASYIALYTTIISLIFLSGGTLAEPKLERYLKRMNADVNMPHEVKTEAALQKMIKQGYLVKIKENVGGEETTDWMVGPRGKIEVGNRGVKGLVTAVYGEDAPEDLADRVRSSLGLKVAEKVEGEVDGGGGAQDVAGENRQRSNSNGRRRRAAEEDD